MTADLEDLCNTIFYGSKLVRGPGTSLDNPYRELSKKLRESIATKLPILTPEPEGLIYPVFVDIRGNCLQEPNGTSRLNGHNISFTIAWVKSMLEDEDFGLSTPDFVVATPYAGQVRLYRRAFRKVGLQDIRVATTEGWQGKEKPVMIVDLVRASNDHGALGFLGKKERLNVLLSRQVMYLFVIGNTTGTQAVFATVSAVDVTPEENADLEAEPATTTPNNDRRNQWVIKVIHWFQQHGRVAEVLMENLTEEYVNFTKDEVANEDAAQLGGWPDEPEGQQKSAPGSSSSSSSEDEAQKKEMARVMAKKAKNAR